MKLVVLGGGGFRVPLVHDALLSDPERLVDELVLHDLDAARLAAVEAVTTQQAEGSHWRPKLRTTTDLDEALPGADLVFSAIRVGGLDGRARDERGALSEGLLGQETVGPGGICYALRTIPVAMRLAERVACLAPGAWLINFTNPAGVVTEAMSTVLGDRVIGICDSPLGLCHRAAHAAGIDPAEAAFDYVGLNHLGWLRRILVHGQDRLPGLLADDRALRGFEEGALFDPEWLRALGAIPNEYLHYFYRTREAIAEIQARTETRGEFLREQQERFYREAAADPSTALSRWRAVRHERDETYLAEARAVAESGPRASGDVDGAGYEGVALRLMTSIACNRADTAILNVRNRGAVPGMAADAVIEVPCLVDGNGAHPLATEPLEGHFAGLISTVKAVERDTITAAVGRSRALALRAIASHPLVDSVSAATRVLDRYAAAFPELADFVENQTRAWRDR